MGILSWIILGLIAGFIGSKLVNKTGQGMLMDIVLGIVGAVVGGFISSRLGLGGVTAWYNPYSIVIAVIGAVVVLLGYRAITGSSRM
ncbi:GlsB/YeaQ/YmgE family stress response membrane protein [Rhodoblastus sp.]|uniref:GlsB/YeaQ/YmgE family stress response membrane protein n=1 Tax=Rhodoblastus sp. TaxID=1962975 RepID=UPI003F9AE57D